MKTLLFLLVSNVAFAEGTIYKTSYKGLPSVRHGFEFLDDVSEPESRAMKKLEAEILPDLRKKGLTVFHYECGSVVQVNNYPKRVYVDCNTYVLK